MIDHVIVTAWLEKYVNAWKSYNAEAIGSQFSEDAKYYYGPFDEPVVGREAIVASWLEDPDLAGTYDAHYAPLAIEGTVAVVNGRSQYFKLGSTAIENEFDNIFVLRFDEQGHCTEFREWYMKH
jgi:hypothetical protein